MSMVLEAVPDSCIPGVAAKHLDPRIFEPF